MSDKLFSSTIASEKLKWKDAFEVGLDAVHARRLIEVAHNYRLTPVKEELREDKGDDLDIAGVTGVGASEHAWRYRKVIPKLITEDM